MKKIILIIALLAFPLVYFGQDAATQATPQEESIYIPQNLEECFAELKKILTREELEEFRSKEEQDIISYHHSLGRWVRNNWGLWSKSRLVKYFNEIGIKHPDDMSGIILDSFHRYLNNKEIRLQEQVEYYQEYWEKIKQKEDSPAPK